MSQSVTFRECRYCHGACIRKGVRNGSQSLRCKSCGKYQKEAYRRKAYLVSDETISSCVKEGLGVRSMARLLNIATNTVIRRILKIASKISKPPIPIAASFEVDELFTFIGSKKKRVCITLAIDKRNGRPIDFYVGPRTKRSLRMVINTLLAGSAKQIYTDHLNLYQDLIPSTIHRRTRYGTNGVERFNLNLRTHLKRLNRRTIAYSRSLSLLNASLIIYIWS